MKKVRSSRERACQLMGSMLGHWVQKSDRSRLVRSRRAPTHGSPSVYRVCAHNFFSDHCGFNNFKLQLSKVETITTKVRATDPRLEKPITGKITASYSKISGSIQSTFSQLKLDHFNIFSSTAPSSTPPAPQPIPST